MNIKILSLLIKLRRIMKRIFLLTVVTFALASFTNAQLFVGGEISFGSTSGKVKSGTVTVEQPSATDFAFAPIIGFGFSDNFEVGLELSFMTSKEKDPTVDPAEEYKASGFGLTPFARYYPIKMDKFGVFLQGGVLFASGSSKTTIGNVTVDGPKMSAVGFTIFPGVSYDLNDNISLLAQIDGFNIGYVKTTLKQTVNIGGTDVEVKDSNNAFGAGVGLNELATTGAITIGAVVRF